MTESTASKAALIQEDGPDHLAQFERGNQTFSLLFTRWMDTNGWSHPTMVSLAKSCLYGRSWLHSSQIAGLRHCNLHSPGPRTFIAIERLNFYLHRYSTKKLLLPGTSSSSLYARPFVITDNGKPPELGWWVEVFCGAREPKDIDLKQAAFSETQAERLSSTWGALIRRLMTQQGIDIIVELDRIVRENYPAKDAKRVQRLIQVIHNQSSWEPEELANELPALTALTGSLGGPTDENELLETLRS
ncbi:MAG: hypothetical protein ACO3LH_05610 [Steroidobacteraceae bacterium]